MRGAAVRLHLDRARGLAAHHHALGALGRQLARLEAQARVPAGEALRVAERGGPPLLVADQQQRGLGVGVAARGQRAEHAEREHDPALHVDGARAEQLLALAAERLVVLVADDGVDVPEQEHAPGAGARQAQQQVGRVAGGGAGQALRGGLARGERGADRRALLGAADVARGRGDADQRLELPLRPRGDLPRAVPDPVVHTQMHCMPELPEMEIVARRLDAALPGPVVESALAPGINALKTFDPPLHALEGRAFTGVNRRGKLLVLELGELVVLVHLMTAGRMQLNPKRGSLRDRAARLMIRLPEDHELRVREFGSKQAMWLKVLRAEKLGDDPALKALGPEAWPDPPPLQELLRAPRPLHSLLRDQQVIAGIGRTWVDEILNVARLSPFKRGDDLDEGEAERLRAAMASELGRVMDVYEAQVQLPLPEKFPKPTRVHAHQGEPCPQCGTTLEAVFYEDYVMSYCPQDQTEGRVLKDRRLSRLLK